MRTFSEEEITAAAPNQNALSNGRKISGSGGFVRRMRSEDERYYGGECKGSGKNNYRVSVFFEEGAAPVFRCSCPSRQFPCKHSIALMFEMAAKKDFELCEIPEDILEKQRKLSAREKKKEEREAEGAAKPKKLSAAGKAARTRKLKKQLEGLALLKALTDRLLGSGLAAFSSAPLKDYKELARQLGDYYLPGPQLLFRKLLFVLERCQSAGKGEDPGERYREALSYLTKLRYLGRRSEEYLKKKLQSDSPEADDNLLYEALGGIWRLEELNALGLKKENAELVQLSFEERYDPVEKLYTDLAYWIDLRDGEISYSANYRPEKAAKYIRSEDSSFSLLRAESVSVYPAAEGELRRIRWEKASLGEIPPESFSRIRSFSETELREALKKAKAQLKNTLSDNTFGILVHYKRIGESGEGKFYLEDRLGERIRLSEDAGNDTALFSLRALPYPGLFREQVLFGLVRYERKGEELLLLPRSIVTEQGIVRLMF